MSRKGHSRPLCIDFTLTNSSTILKRQESGPTICTICLYRSLSDPQPPEGLYEHFIKYTDSDHLPTYETVIEAFKLFPETSPICKSLIDIYCERFRPNCDDDQEKQLRSNIQRFWFERSDFHNRSRQTFHFGNILGILSSQKKML